MGNSTGSMLYMFGIIIAIYIVGMGLYQLVKYLKDKWKFRKQGYIMANVIIVVLIVALLAVAFKNALKHFRGEALCCGGGGD